MLLSIDNSSLMEEIVARTDELRLMTKVARLYYEQDVRQVDIATQILSE